MLRKWRLGNFKSVGKKTELQMAPLTIFAGPNSSGKSTWIQSILLISQTLSSKIQSRSVVLNGQLTKLGQFDDLKSHNGDGKTISIGWDCVPQTTHKINFFGKNAHKFPMMWHGFENFEEINFDLEFFADEFSPEKEILQIQPKLASCSMVCKSCDEANEFVPTSSIHTKVMDSDGQNVLVQEKLLQFGIGAIENEIVKKSLDYEVDLNGESLKEFRDEWGGTPKLLGCSFRHFLPTQITFAYDIIKEQARILWLNICDIQGPTSRRQKIYYDSLYIPNSVIKILYGVLGDKIYPLIDIREKDLFTDEYLDTVKIPLKTWIDRRRRLRNSNRVELRNQIQSHSKEILRAINSTTDKKTQFSLESTRVPGNLLDASYYLDSYFTNCVKYLGPLRDEPKALYPLAAAVDPTDVGLRGEYTAAVLDLHKGHPISFIPSSCFQSFETDSDLNAVVSSLGEAVNDWLRYLGVADGVETRDKGKLGHELKVVSNTTQKEHDLTHVGVGVSQVLPILVVSLLAEPDTVIIIEQPELHLHPRVQTLLGDFFLSMALVGKQCLLETHSEYLINRIRLRSALSKDDMITKITKIYFVENNDNVSEYSEIKFNKYGAILNWPKGFFDQSQIEAEAILSASIKKKKRERSNTKVGM